MIVIDDDRRHTVTAASGSGARDAAAAFEEGDVAPVAVVAADLLPGADDAESSLLVEPQACLILGEDGRLDGPDPVGFGGTDQGIEQRGTNAAATCAGMDVDGVLDDTAVHGTR